MKTLRELLAFEGKRCLRWREIILFITIALIALFFIQYGKDKYLKTPENVKNFQESENNRVSQYVLYRQYGAFGIKLLFVSSPYIAIFNDPVFDGLTASINIAERLDINKSLKGGDFFISRSWYMTFSGIILLFGVLVSILYGFDTTKSREYLNLLSDLTGSKKVFWWAMSSRAIYLNLAFLLLILISVLSLLISHINLFQLPFLIFLVALILMINFFFVSGCVIGSIKKSIRGIVLGVFYFLSVLLIPYLAEIDAEFKATKIEPVSKFDLHNQKIIMKNDRELIDKYGSLKSNEPPPPAVVKAMKDASKNEHVKIAVRESVMRNKMLKNVKRTQTLSAFFPVLLYISTAKEISSHGGLSLVDFYVFSQQVKRGFIDFYVQKRFPEGSNQEHKESPKAQNNQVENFVKKDENLFFAREHLPARFLLGVLMTVFYILAMLFILYLIHVKKLKAKGYSEKPGIDIKKSSSLLVLCKSEEVKSNIFHYFQGQEDAVCISRIDVDFHFDSIRADIVLGHLCRLAEANEQKAIEYLSILGIKDLKTLKLGEEEILILYALAKLSGDDYEYIVLDDFFKQRSRQFEESLFKLFEELETAGKRFLHLSCEMFLSNCTLNSKLIVPAETIPFNYNQVTMR